MGRHITTGRDRRRNDIYAILNRTFPVTPALQWDEPMNLPVDQLTGLLIHRAGGVDRGTEMSERVLAEARRFLAGQVGKTPDEVAPDASLEELLADKARRKEIWAGLCKKFRGAVPALPYPLWATLFGLLAGTAVFVSIVCLLPGWAARNIKFDFLRNLGEMGVIGIILFLSVAAGGCVISLVRWLLGAAFRTSLPSGYLTPTDLVMPIIAGIPKDEQLGWTTEQIAAHVYAAISQVTGTPIPKIMAERLTMKV